MPTYAEAGADYIRRASLVIREHLKNARAYEDLEAEDRAAVDWLSDLDRSRQLANLLEQAPTTSFSEYEHQPFDIMGTLSEQIRDVDVTRATNFGLLIRMMGLAVEQMRVWAQKYPQAQEEFDIRKTAAHLEHFAQRANEAPNEPASFATQITPKDPEILQAFFKSQAKLS